MKRERTVSVLTAAIVYAAAIFAIGFALGAIRVTMTAPALGVPLATLIELPVMLAASWYLCADVVGRFGVPPVAGDRLAMGAIAFAALMTLEFLLGVFGFRRSLSELVQGYREVGPAMGPLAQIAFAAFPSLQLRIATT